MRSGARSLRPAQVSPGSCVTGRWPLPGWFRGTGKFPRLRLMTGCVQYFLSPDPQRGPQPVDCEEGDLSRAPVRGGEPGCAVLESTWSQVSACVHGWFSFSLSEGNICEGSAGRPVFSYLMPVL